MNKLIMNHKLIVLLLLALPFAGACDSAGPQEEETPVEVPPSFEISTRTVVLQDGTPGIEFYLIPDVDVILVRAELDPPINDAIVFNAGSSTIVRGETFALQAAGTAYRKISGNWEITLVGSKAVGSQASFNVTVTVNVGA